MKLNPAIVAARGGDAPCPEQWTACFYILLGIDATKKPLGKGQTEGL